MSTSIKNVAESVRPILEPIQEIDFELEILKPCYDEIGKMLKEADDIATKYKSIVIELGYPPLMEMPMDYVKKIVTDYKEHNIEYVAEYIDELVLAFHNEQFLWEMAQKWENKKLASSRIHILKNAIKCHNLQMYDASIPTLLPQLDGIVADAFGHTGKFNGYHMKTYLEHMLKKNLNKDEFTLTDALHEYYTKNLLVGFEFGEQITSDVSRHAILHGGNTQYGKPVNSLKLILVFDFLLTVLNDASEDIIQAAKQEIK